MHNAGNGYGFPKEEIGMAKQIQNIPKMSQKGYIRLMLL
jgi:hypothetical protein